MIAIIFITGTKYDRNDDYSRDVIWMQSQFRMGLNMIAVSISNRSIYNCNLYQLRPNMIAMIEKFFSRDSSRNHSHVIAIILQSPLQSYLVPIGKDCNHICSDWELTLQSYLVPYETEI